MRVILKGHKPKRSFLERFAEWIDIISDYRLCRDAGWTFSQLAAERESHPVDVLIAEVFILEEAKVNKEQVDKMKRKMAKVK